MRRNDLTGMRTKTIDDVTAARIRQYEDRSGTRVTLPVPVENIVEQILGLDFDWTDIDEREGEQILAGLIPERRLIVLNSRHLSLFARKPGLERSTIGHEAGHWDLDIDRASLRQPRLPGLEVSDPWVHRHGAESRVLKEVLNRAVHDDRYYRLYRELTCGLDSPEVKSAVERYQSSLLMPDWLIREAVRSIDVTSWPDLYSLAETAEVTISNLVCRLRRLGLLYVHEGTGTLYHHRDEWAGQKMLFPARR